MADVSDICCGATGCNTVNCQRAKHYLSLSEAERDLAFGPYHKREDLPRLTRLGLQEIEGGLCQCEDEGEAGAAVTGADPSSLSLATLEASTDPLAVEGAGGGGDGGGAVMADTPGRWPWWLFILFVYGLGRAILLPGP
ncbi:MAG: hypothetical protein GWM92_15725 [Gemmatimonadetes bacterium]|nr:hypothetical protein [Gemmatimonadota bacterium]NIR80181.1 hypothetical protein [Gemmatimonadota bacterium]NIT88943.1 hypothetical protein [Gemmatimonadota bacterium]NIU32738.1 hypothetical protein [Gemmatimonadota bacterium]NIU37170.1 hypothetical protein [Gemmatimonadota bacterium]